MGTCTQQTRRIATPTIKMYAENAGLHGTAAVIATAIALAESSGNQFAKNCDSNGTVDYGLWQINSSHHQFDPTRLLEDPEYNAAAMASISNGGKSWTPWSTYNENKWQQFVSQVPKGQGTLITKGGPGGYVPHEKEALEGGVLETLTPEPEAKEGLAFLKPIGEAFKFLESKESWLRILKIGAGGILLFIAVDELFKTNQGTRQQGLSGGLQRGLAARAERVTAPKKAPTEIVHRTIRQSAAEGAAVVPK